MRLSTFLATVALATAAILPAAPSAAYDTSSVGTINVRVVSATNGMPLERVPVQVSVAGTTVDALTDKSGYVHFAAVQSGIASVETSERAIGACAQTVAVRKGAATDVTIRLLPADQLNDGWTPRLSSCGNF